MAPIKFEDKLKDKLENRSLQPSADAWNSLAERLDKEDEKNSNARFWWISIAASFIGVVLITTMFYENTRNQKALPIVVKSKTDIQNESKLATKSLSGDEKVAISEVDKENIKVINAMEFVSLGNKNLEKQPTKKQKSLDQSMEQSKVSQDMITSSDTSKWLADDNLRVKVPSHEELKIMEVVAEIKQLQLNETSLSDKEIDSLLKQAQREILKQRIFDETSGAIDAYALLQDVEVELEQSFRDRVLDALNSSYNSVKTAVVERRN